MNYILFDFGNTALKVRLCVDSVLCGALSRYVYNLEEARRLHQYLTELVATRPGLVCVVCSVVTDSTIKLMLGDVIARLGFYCVQLRSHAMAGKVTNGYAQAEQLGVDRWAAIVGAAGRYPGPVAVIDCGTAINVEYIDQEARYLGGMILLGLPMWERALGSAQGLAGLKLDDVSTYDHVGTTTRACVEAGISALYNGVLLYVLQTAVKVLGDDVVVVLTGGDAGLITHTDARLVYDPDLLFYGMMELARDEIARK